MNQTLEINVDDQGHILISETELLADVNDFIQQERDRHAIMIAASKWSDSL